MKNKSGHTILHRTAKLPIVLLYLSFLIVQVFSFNFDICNRNNTNTQVLSWYHSSTSVKTIVHAEKANTGKDAKINIRLNKRFQPEKAIYCNSVSVKTPGYSLTEKPLVAYSNNKVASPAFATHLLRGPPATA